jgi:hypothetical protein
MEVSIAAVTREVDFKGRRSTREEFPGSSTEAQEGNPAKALDQMNHFHGQSGSKMRLGHEQINTQYELVGNGHRAQTRHEFLVRFRVNRSSHSIHPFQNSTTSQ